MAKNEIVLMLRHCATCPNWKSDMVQLYIYLKSCLALLPLCRSRASPCSTDYLPSCYLPACYLHR